MFRRRGNTPVVLHTAVILTGYKCVFFTDKTLVKTSRWVHLLFLTSHYLHESSRRHPIIRTDGLREFPSAQQP
jgi:hypothetical protein